MGVINTKTETEIRERINELTAKLKSINATIHRDNYLIYSEEVKAKFDCLYEIRHLCWVLDEPVPESILDLIRWPFERTDISIFDATIIQYNCSILLVNMVSWRFYEFFDVCIESSGTTAYRSYIDISTKCATLSTFDLWPICRDVLFRQVFANLF